MYIYMIWKQGSINLIIAYNICPNVQFWEIWHKVYIDIPGQSL